MLRQLCWVVGYIAMLFGSVSAAYAVDIHLKAQASVPGPTVRLADVAEIHDAAGSSDAQQLGQTELFPVPSQEKYITAQQVREALLARGVDLRAHAISGASIIALVPEDAAAPNNIFARRSATADQEAAERGLSPAAAAILRFLKSQVDADLPWQVDLAPVENSRPPTRAIRGRKWPETRERRLPPTSRWRKPNIARSAAAFALGWAASNS